jgi:type IV pilus assembly protein PilA
MKALQRGFTLVELMIVVTIIGILAATAISNFKLFQSRSKQSEAKINLRGIYTAKMTHYGETDTFHCRDEFGNLGGSYVSCCGRVMKGDAFCGWSTGGTARYTYFAGPALRVPTCDSVDCGQDLCDAVNSQRPPAEGERTFTATAVANIDSDSVCDLWSVNDAGGLVNHINDVTEGRDDE